MRIAVLAFSTVLLSGCSWLGFGGNKQDRYAGQHYGGQYHGQQGYGHQAQKGQYGQRGGNPCQISHASQPVPQGCRPEQVTIGLPQYGGQGYGQQAGYSHQGYQTPSQTAYGQQAQIPTSGQYPLQSNVPNRFGDRPRLRLNGALGVETSLSGTAYNAAGLTNLYVPADHREGRIEGTAAGGSVTTTEFLIGDVDQTPIADNAFVARTPDVSFSDLYAAPISFTVGGEYLVTPNVGIVANVGYTHAAGRSGGGASYEADVIQRVTIDEYDDPGTGPVYIGTIGPNNAFRRNATVAYTDLEVSDLERIDWDVGGKYYFKPAFAQYMERPLTPYVGATLGAAHFSETSVSQKHYRLLLEDYMVNGGQSSNYDLISETGVTTLIEDGWVPTGTLTIGAEWQVSDAASIGLETGVRYEGARDRTDGSETGDNYSIPLKIRGSIGF